MYKKNLHSFIRLLSLTFVYFSINSGVNAQTVDIIANASASQNIVTGNGAYHVGEAIYLNSEIGANNFTTAASALNSIGFNVDVVGAPTTFASFNIYLKETTASTLAAGPYNKTGYTQVYSGPLNLPTIGWNSVTLTTPFIRTAGSNLQIMLERLDGIVPTAPWTYKSSNGNTANPAAITTRRYNGAAAPVVGTTNLTTSAFRPQIRFARLLNADAAVSDIVTPASSCFNTLQSITVNFDNEGSTTSIGAGAATITLNIAGANTFTGSTTNTTTIAPGGSGSVTFSGINLNSPGTNNIEAIIKFGTIDENANNDTLRTNFITSSIISAFPISETLEVFPLPLIHSPYILEGDRNLWTVRTGKYKNGDLSDSLAPHSGTSFFLFDAWGGSSSNGFRSLVISNCLQLPAASAGSTHNVSFWMSHDTSYTNSQFGFFPDSLYVTVSTDKGLTWNRVSGYERNDASFAKPGWRMETADLSAYAGQLIQIGFEGVSKYGNVIGLDDITVNASSLPVTLVSFTGVREGAINSLKWITATEINNAGFELERSVDGSKFSKVSFIESKSEGGNSTRKLTYEFSDNRPFATANYYRLKQVDKDGKFKYSNIVLLKGSKTTQLTLAAVYPNPTVSKLNLSVASPVSEKVTVVITDLAGKVVMQNAAQLISGDNNISLDVKAIANGTYNVKIISSNGGNSNAKFVKQ